MCEQGILGSYSGCWVPRGGAVRAGPATRCFHFDKVGGEGGADFQDLRGGARPSDCPWDQGPPWEACPEEGAVPWGQAQWE